MSIKLGALFAREVWSYSRILQHLLIALHSFIQANLSCYYRKESCSTILYHGASERTFD